MPSVSSGAPDAARWSPSSTGIGVTLHPNEHNEREISLNTAPVSLRQESKQSLAYLSHPERWCLDLCSKQDQVPP